MIGPERTTQYATFEVGAHHLAIRVREVQEVLLRQRLTAVPMAPPLIAGLINLRGQIIPALEMRRLLHLPARGAEEDNLSVVLQTETGPVSLQVDAIGDVLEIDSFCLEEPPLNLDPHVKRIVSRVCQVKEILLLVLDTGRTVDVSAEYTQGGPPTI